MKKIILLIVSVWMCVSCGNLEEMNIDPDNATQTHPKLLLTQICMNAFKRGTDGMYATKKVNSSRRRECRSILQMDPRKFWLL